jgi:hypothetical protein
MVAWLPFGSALFAVSLDAVQEFRFTHNQITRMIAIRWFSEQTGVRWMPIRRVLQEGGTARGRELASGIEGGPEQGWFWLSAVRQIKNTKTMHRRDFSRGGRFGLNRPRNDHPCGSDRGSKHFVRDLF